MANKTQDKKDRFSNCARLALLKAQQAAERMGHGWIGAEHILLGLLETETSVAALVLKEFGLAAGSVETLVQQMTQAPVRELSETMKLNQSVKSLLEHAVDQARLRSLKVVGTGHLLLGLLDLQPGVGFKLLDRLGLVEYERDIALQILDRLNIDLKNLRLRTTQTLRDSVNAAEE